MLASVWKLDTITSVRLPCWKTILPWRASIITGRWRSIPIHKTPKESCGYSICVKRSAKLKKAAKGFSRKDEAVDAAEIAYCNLLHWRGGIFFGSDHQPGRALARLCAQAKKTGALV